MDRAIGRVNIHDCDVGHLPTLVGQCQHVAVRFSHQCAAVTAEMIVILSLFWSPFGFRRKARCLAFPLTKMGGEFQPFEVFSKVAPFRLSAGADPRCAKPARLRRLQGS